MAARLVCARSVVFCQNFWQFTQLLPGNWRGGGKRFSGAFRAGAPSPPRFSFSSARFFLCLLLPSACYAGYRVDEAVSWTQRFLTRKFRIKNRSLFMTNKFKRKCLQKFYVWSKQEKEWYRKTTSYLEQPSRHFCQHFMRRTTQQTLQKTENTKALLLFSVKETVQTFSGPFKPLHCCLRSDKLVNCHV